MSSTVISGISVPLTFSAIGGLTTSTDIGKLKYNMQMAITTPLGSRVFQPEYGSNVNLMLGEPSDLIFDSILMKEVKKVIKRWVPEVDVTKVSIVKTQNGKYSFVYVQFVVVTFKVTDSMLVLFEV